MIDVDLWIWPLNQPADRHAALRAHLSADEALRASRFLRQTDRLHFEAARGRMREILAEVTSIPPASLQLGTGPHGKPFLEGGPEFNLSHSAGWAALAVTADTPVGIDIEKLRDMERDVARRFFSPAEVTALETLDPDSWQDGFFRCWTRKEAVVKALGTGLTTPLDAFDVTLRPGQEARVRGMRIGGHSAADWTLTHLDLAADFVGAIALRGPARIHLREGRLPIA